MAAPPCVPTTLLLRALAHGAALEARVAALSRPKAPRDFGLVADLTPTETRVVMALLPPGEAFHRDALIARAWPDVAAAGLVGASVGLWNTHVNRVRLKLRACGWRVASAYGHGLYVLLAPGDAVPVGYGAFDGASTPDRHFDRTRPCPDCEGRMAHDSRRCAGCWATLRAARSPSHPCPACGEPRAKGKKRLCWACHLLRRRGALKGWVAA